MGSYERVWCYLVGLIGIQCSLIGLLCKSHDWVHTKRDTIGVVRLFGVLCDTEAKMPTIRKTMKTINMCDWRVSITAVISSRALSVNTKVFYLFLESYHLCELPCEVAGVSDPYYHGNQGPSYFSIMGILLDHNKSNIEDDNPILKSCIFKISLCYWDLYDYHLKYEQV